MRFIYGWRACTNVQLDLYTQIILSVLSVYQSENKGIRNNDTGWKFKINVVGSTMEVIILMHKTAEQLRWVASLNSMTSDVNSGYYIIKLNTVFAVS
jgi:hypothetical protein